MSPTSPLDTLEDLARLEIDAAWAMEAAASMVDDDALATELLGMRDSHLREVSNISKVITDLGGEPPALAIDFEGFATPGFIDVRKLHGKRQIVEAARDIERMRKARFESAGRVLNDLPVSARTLLGESYMGEETRLADLERHLDVGGL